MKMSWENRIVIFASTLVAILVSWAFFRRPESTSLYNLLNAGAHRFLQWPLFTMGKLPITPLFLIKCSLFLIALSVFSRLFRGFLANRVLTHTSMDRGHQYAFVRATGYVIFALGLIVGLDTTGLNLRSLVVVGGALGVGIGFGLQNIVANFVAGIVILWEGPIKLGDFIDVGNTHGEVIRIGARGTWVRTFDNEVIIVPNSEFINTRVANWTANDRTVRLTVPVGISYDCDLEAVRGVLLEIARRNEHVLQDPAPAVLVTGFGDHAINLNLRVSTTTMIDRTGLLISDLLAEIFRVFREKKIVLPFPIAS
ncbi:MAG: mechanosensitive ion channel domain-containing protein [Candidatus Acidiferrales bacterium]